MNIKNNKNMKKKYISPEIEILSCAPISVIAASLPVDQGPSNEGDYEEAANEYRGSWNDIWGGM